MAVFNPEILCEKIECGISLRFNDDMLGGAAILVTETVPGLFRVSGLSGLMSIS